MRQVWQLTMITVIFTLAALMTSTTDAVAENDLVLRHKIKASRLEAGGVGPLAPFATKGY